MKAAYFFVSLQLLMHNHSERLKLDLIKWGWMQISRKNIAYPDS